MAAAREKVTEILTGWTWPIWSHSLIWAGIEVLLFGGGWTLYFLLSARIANTYYFRGEAGGLESTFA